MMPTTQGTTIQRQGEAEALASTPDPHSVRAARRRLEHILSDDREMLISLQCQLDQIRGGSQPPDDEREHQLHH